MCELMFMIVVFKSHWTYVSTKIMGGVLALVALVQRLYT